jgi:uncharacterized protein HemX
MQNIENVETEESKETRRERRARIRAEIKEKRRNKHGNIRLTAFICLIALAALSACAYLYLENQSLKKSNEERNQAINQEESEPTESEEIPQAPVANDSDDEYTGVSDIHEVEPAYILVRVAGLLAHARA